MSQRPAQGGRPAPSRQGAAKTLPVAIAPYTTASFVRRPGFGQAGMKTSVIANHYAIAFRQGGATAHHYDVLMEPEPSRNVMNKIWQEWEKQCAPKLNMIAVFDGAKNAYSPSALPKNADEMTFTVTLPPNPDAPPKKREPKDFKLTLRLVNSIQLSELNAFVNGKTQISPNVITSIQVLDVLFRQIAAKANVVSGRSVFSREARPEPLSGGLELWSGLFQSVRPGAGSLSLNVDTSYTAFLRSMPMINFVQEVIGQINKAQELHDRDRTRIEKLLRQAIISAVHRSDCKPRHRVLKLSRTSAENTKFMYAPQGDESQAKEISVAQYFKMQYNKPLQYPKLPCLVVGNIQRHTFLPMEVAFIESAQKYRGKLDDRQTADVIKISAKKPFERKKAIESLSQSMLKVGQGNEYTNAFGVNVDSKLMEVDARILPAPRLMLGANKSSAPRDGAWNFINYEVVNPSKLTAIGVCCMDSRLRDRELRDWMGNLFNVAGKMGLTLENKVDERYPVVTVRGPGLNNVESALKQLHGEVQKSFNQNPQLLICILPRREVPMYAKIKSIGDTLFGVPTQCMVVNKLQRANDQYFANVVLKINVKVAGPFANFKLNPREYFQEPTMLLGCDVTHPAPGTSQPSIAAMVGSTTPFSADRFSTVVRVVKSRQEELSEDIMREMFAKLLRTFYVTNGNRFPSRIIFFRDGVSEGQFEAVHRNEVTAIRAVLEKAGAKTTKLSFLLVQKRHHTRFFASNPKDTDRTGNLKAGVVVERGVTHPTDYDFFLQSQAGLQGTARPTRYFVLYDEIKWQPDQLQMFCYHLCYTYARCTRSVSVSPPAYYAHLACFRARHHLTGANMDGSETSMASQSSGGETLTAERLQQFNQAVQPKDSLTHSMFFM